MIDLYLNKHQAHSARGAGSGWRERAGAGRWGGQAAADTDSEAVGAGGSRNWKKANEQGEVDRKRVFTGLQSI